ncbi:Peptidyl-tRNA hydrolase [hydrothermal vent metagenome]|uniref:peptidyl-tRNA hydrolase n=1 Tax=hydrothermal vent metagenome TaxID=652676 RepID=A0A3B0RME1_9ZZZZ
MKLLAGLGNPGSKYANNRHNVGFMVIDEIADAWGFANWRKRFQAQTSEGLIEGQKVLLLKPTTYMNESGRALGEAARFYNLSLDDIFVIHDELDLPSGKMRTKTGGGHAGNNGVRSIKAHLGDDFHRVRIGVGHPGDKSKVSGHVLKDFAKSDQQWLSRMITAIADEVPLLLSGELSSFQNKVHLATNSK